MKIVFDFAGVCFRWSPDALVKRELPERARDDTTAAHWVAQIFQGYEGDWSAFDRGTVEPAALVRQIAQRTGLAQAEVQRVVDGVPRELQPVAETIALVEALRRAGHRLYYLSNMPAPYADLLEAQHAFIAGFEDGVFSARVQAVKPEPRIFQIAAQRFRAVPSELWFFDDHLPNVEAARQLGWRAHHFTDAAAARAVLRA